MNIVFIYLHRRFVKDDELHSTTSYAIVQYQYFCKKTHKSFQWIKDFHSILFENPWLINQFHAINTFSCSLPLLHTFWRTNHSYNRLNVVVPLSGPCSDCDTSECTSCNVDLCCSDGIANSMDPKRHSFLSAGIRLYREMYSSPEVNARYIDVFVTFYLKKRAKYSTQLMLPLNAVKQILWKCANN